MRFNGYGKGWNRTLNGRALMTQVLKVTQGDDTYAVQMNKGKAVSVLGIFEGGAINPVDKKTAKAVVGKYNSLRTFCG